MLLGVTFKCQGTSIEGVLEGVPLFLLFIFQNMNLCYLGLRDNTLAVVMGCGATYMYGIICDAIVQ